MVGNIITSVFSSKTEENFVFMLGFTGVFIFILRVSSALEQGDEEDDGAV